MTEATIWSPDFFKMGAAFLPWGIAAISIFVFGAKGTKQYELKHLFCGLFLILFGMATHARQRADTHVAVVARDVLG